MGCGNVAGHGSSTSIKQALPLLPRICPPVSAIECVAIQLSLPTPGPISINQPDDNPAVLSILCLRIILKYLD